MRALIGVAVVALLAGPAYAQKPALNLMQEKEKNPAVEEYRKAIDQEYKAATEKIPDQKKKSSDPWQNMRSAEPSRKKEKSQR